MAWNMQKCLWSVMLSDEIRVPESSMKLNILRVSKLIGQKLLVHEQLNWIETKTQINQMLIEFFNSIT